MNCTSLRLIPLLCSLVATLAPTLAHAAPAAASGTASPVILTPKSPATPRINGARIFGVRPNRPFLFTIAATGKRPMQFSAVNLPEGLSLDPATGQITGMLNNKGEFTATLRAKNALGQAERKLKIVCGDKIALTPPLGWNSWNCFANAVDDAKVRAAADAMVSSGLRDHGWTYINIDDCWEAGRDEAGNILGNERFPDMKALGEYIHGKGLKFGIYSSPGPKTCAQYTASYQHEDQDARSYAQWGVDYVKYDWCSYHQVARMLTHERCAKLVPAEDLESYNKLGKEWDVLDANRKRTKEEHARLRQVKSETEAIEAKIHPEEKKKIDLAILQEPYKLFRSSLDKVNRDIVYSFCQYGMGNVWEWGAAAGGDCWRTTGDITDTWQSLSGIGFSQNGHEKFAGPGHWNDPDMLIVGHVGWGPKLHPTRLTPDEQYTHISLWSLLSSPLLIGCDMTQMDPFTFSLLSNDEVIDVNQDPLGRPAARVSQADQLEVWARELEDGSRAVGLFNRGDKAATVTASWKDLGINGRQVVRDLWRQKDLGKFTEQFQASVPSHGVVLVRLLPASGNQ